MESFEAGVHIHTQPELILYIYMGGGGGVFHAIGYQELLHLVEQSTAFALRISKNLINI